jgi:putative ABC transport system permease protein
MLIHLLKMVWNRKRGNALLVVEIFFTFLVVFAVSLAAAYLLDNLGRPLGFRFDRVWAVAIELDQSSDDEWSGEQVETFSRLLREAESLPWVEAAAGAMTTPYGFAGSTNNSEWQGRTVTTDAVEVTDGFADVMGLRLVEGRWFEDADQALGWEPAVVNRELARDLYGEASPLGKPTRLDGDGGPADRFVGVGADFRRGGELAPPTNVRFARVRLGDPASRPPRNLLVRVAPGSGGDREQELVERLSATAPRWSFEVRTMPELRTAFYRLALAPLIAGALVAGFLLLMVGLGLMGVVWQNVTRRTREIGLRRAAGASGAAIRRQLLGELLLTASLGLVAGAVLVLQLPALGVLAFVPWRVVVAGVVLALAVLVLITAGSGLYPSWLASRMSPAEALRYE